MTQTSREERRTYLNLLKRIGKSEPEIEKLLADETVRDSQIMDALEYGRIVHAEMSALTDAARLELSVKDATLYCTTFPCHMCAKHVVGAGLATVVFLEPYPKSLALDLHTDAIQVETGERGKYQAYPSVRFEHFFGITPRRYRELFERGSRKHQGVFTEYASGVKRPILDYTEPFYHHIEEYIIETSTVVIGTAIKEAGHST